MRMSSPAGPPPLSLFSPDVLRGLFLMVKTSNGEIAKKGGNLGNCTDEQDGAFVLFQGLACLIEMLHRAGPIPYPLLIAQSHNTIYCTITMDKSAHPPASLQVLSLWSIFNPIPCQSIRPKGVCSINVPSVLLAVCYW